MSDNKEIAETFNNYFNNAMKSLNLQCDPESLSDVSDEKDPVEIAIKKCKNYLQLLVLIKLKKND